MSFCRKIYYKLISYYYKYSNKRCDRHDLLKACRDNDLEAIKCITNGSCYTQDVYGALHEACFRGHLEIVKYFVNHFGTELDEAVMIANLEGHLDIIRFLIAKGANIEYYSDKIKKACLAERRLIVMDTLLDKTNMYKDVIGLVQGYITIE